MKITKLSKFTLIGGIALGAFIASPTASAAWFAGDGGSGEGNFDKKPFTIGVNVIQGWDSNVNMSSTDEQQSAFTGGSLTLSTAMGGRRTQLEAGLTAGYNYYWDTDEDNNDSFFRLSLAVNHRVNRRMLLSFNTYTAYQIEPDYYDSLTLSRRSGHYFYSNSTIGMTYQWNNKFSTVTSYSFAAVTYDESSVGDIEDRIENIFAQSFRYLVHPTTVLVLEYRYQKVDYKTNENNSDTNYIIAGVDHNFTPRMRGAFRGGAEFRSDSGGDNSSPYGEMTLTYGYGEGSSVRWINRYGYEQSDLVGNGATNASLRSGVVATQRLTARMNLNLGVYYQNSVYDGREGGDVEDNLISANLGFSYQINRHFNVNAGYTYTDQSSDDPFREYNRNRVFIGLGATF